MLWFGFVPGLPNAFFTSFPVAGAFDFAMGAGISGLVEVFRVGEDEGVDFFRCIPLGGVGARPVDGFMGVLSDSFSRGFLNILIPRHKTKKFVGERFGVVIAFEWHHMIAC